MFRFHDLKSIHLEITNNCQASCPMCARNDHGGLSNPLIKLKDWTLDDFKNIINKEVLAQIEHLYFCGNFGDPLVNNNLLEMCEYVRDNSDILVRIHTNGSLRSEEWWKKLAKVMPKNHMVIFGIDGLADTHHLYRIGTDWHKIIANARAFIQAGGIAEWAYIKFEHNQHQVEDARKIADEIGFKSFTVKNTIRFLEPDYPVYDKNGETKYYIKPPTDNVVKFVDKDIISQFNTWYSSVEIDCQVKQNKEIYIDAFGHLYPCCWMGSTQYQYNKPDTIIYPYKQQSVKEQGEWLEDLGGQDSLDLNKVSIKEVLDSKKWETIWNTYWHTKKMLVCAKNCGNTKENMFSKPKDQFVERINFD